MAKVGWSDAEKLQLLFCFMPAKLDWAGAALPPGRTKKACIHAIDKMRNEMKAAGITPVANGAVTRSPTKATAMKRAQVATEEDDDDDGAQAEVAKKPAAKKRKVAMKAAPKTKEAIKSEEDEEDFL